MSGNYRLTRPDHQTSLAGCIQEEKEFQYVTLACEDQQVRAHKVVLAAGSSKLRKILLGNPHPTPLIYLTGVKFSILEYIVRFIYHGEVDISPDQVNCEHLPKGRPGTQSEGPDGSSRERTDWR